MLPIVLIMFVVASAQQVADPKVPEVANPTHELARGPIVMVDEAHGNFHTANGRYAPFAELLTRDGYRIARSRNTLTVTALQKGHLLVISNALAERNIEEWSLPTPSAFTA